MSSDSPYVIVFDGNPDALDRRRTALALAAPHARVVATPSRTAVLVLAAAAGPGATALVDLSTTDRLTLDRPGERLIERLARGPATSHVRAVAWSAHVGPDVVEGVRRAGGAGFVTASLRREREAAELRRVIAGEAVWPQRPVVAGAWEAWFAGAFGTAWQPWMEPVLVRLASGDERGSVAADLVAIGAARSANHATARMREVARLVAGEHSNAPTAVAARAALVLARLAARRPLPERPEVLVSLGQVAAALQTAPSLAVAAGLTGPELDDLLALDQLIRDQRAAQAPSAGAPPADRVRAERRWAAGRRALALGAQREDVDEVIVGILARLGDALVAVDDALEDARTHPAGRAAAALLALEAAPGAAADGVLRNAEGRALWRGHVAEELASSDAVEEAELVAFTARVDAALVAGAPACGGIA